MLTGDFVEIDLDHPYFVDPECIQEAIREYNAASSSPSEQASPKAQKSPKAATLSDSESQSPLQTESPSKTDESLG
eukprot:scaffold64527_cov38-Prasinocladus_malaysianus.AAC.1